MSGDHRDDRGRPDLDRDGVPLPTEPPGELAEVFPLHPPTGDHGLGQPAPGHGGLVVEDLGAVLDRVETAGPPGWLVQGLWPADAYGVLAAEDKAGKTWAILDLAVSVAAGGSWLGYFRCPQAGRVLVFLGEGNQRAIICRLRAICAHKDLQVEDLAARMRLCFRVPASPAAPTWQPARRRWWSWTRCTWRSGSPAPAPTCTPWVTSCRPSKGCASLGSHWGHIWAMNDQAGGGRDGGAPAALPSDFDALMA